jgi:hypothetical protein
LIKEIPVANIRNFSDYTGEAIELAFVTSMPNAEFRARFPGVRGIRYDGYTMWVGRNAAGAAYLPVTRKIEYKAQPSRHECNAKCLNGKHTGTCECRCGGKNHGAGMFTQLIAA